MKFKYHFANETVEIDVSEEWCNILVDLDRAEYNNNHTETRRHYHIEACEYEGEDYGAEDSSLAALFEDVSLEDRLPAAISKLQPQQQELIQRVFFNGERLVDIAAQEGVSKAAISRRLSKIYASLEKNLSRGG